MQMVRVIADYFPVNPGELVQLNGDQADARAFALKVRPDIADNVFEVLRRTGFKRGETFGYGSTPDKQRLAAIVDPESGRAFDLAAFRVEVAETPAEELDDEQLAAVALAIAGMDPDDESQFTKSGKPDAKVLTEAVGFTVTAKARDALWAAHQAVVSATTAAEGEGADGSDGGPGSLV